MFLHRLIESHWQTPKPYLTWLLSPLSKCFLKVVNKRRTAFLSGSLNSTKLPCPVVVVGNIHAGGTGKTPISSALVRAFQEKGIQIGVISRGYGRKKNDVALVDFSCCADEVGDEPLMLFRQTGAPIAVAANRVLAAEALLRAHPHLQLILADDGLQHYALSRDWEICVFPQADLSRADSLDVLPNGILREPIERLRSVDCVLISQADSQDSDCVRHALRLPEKVLLAKSETHPDVPYRLNNPNEKWFSGSLKTGQTCAAIAAIAKPERFFHTLNQMGFVLNETRTLPDHQAIDLHQLPKADVVFITEKDAVKLPKNVPEHIWVLPIKARIEPDLAQVILDKLNIQAA